jgi:hypothetical protein
LQEADDELSRELDALENESHPVLEIDQQQLDFVDIRFKIATTRSFIISNKGKVVLFTVDSRL